ncbi:MAG TPA: RNA polymerase sigma factor [Polyangiaceae bacterium]
MRRTQRRARRGCPTPSFFITSGSPSSFFGAGGLVAETSSMVGFLLFDARTEALPTLRSKMARVSRVPGFRAPIKHNKIIDLDASSRGISPQYGRTVGSASVPSSKGRELTGRSSDLETLEEAARAVSRDPGAFERLVEGTFEKLVRYAARVTGDLAEAEDVVQESYVKAYRALAGGHFEGRSSVSTWLYRIVTRTAIDQRRSRSRREVLGDLLLDGALDGAAAADSHVALRELSDLLGELPEEQRSALVLQALEGFTNREIAEILECSEGAVEQRLVRARAALRKKEPA